ncbi:bone morphogenetic protein 7-like [Leptodactylus fuscus]|uniref:bone morphogenetic protein 7-like n=1 Tax=Leptodactylus fuscus TaxID=238119 RepID=UPI003F4F28F9
MELRRSFRWVFNIFLSYILLRIVAADPAIRHASHPSFAQRTLKGHERREIQKEILSVLGLSHRPRPQFHGKQTSAPMFMMDLYNSLHIGEEQENVASPYDKQFLTDDETSFVGPDEVHFLDDADLVMSFVNLLEDVDVCPQCYSKELRFDLRDIPAGEQLTSGELKIYKDTIPYNKTYQISVYQVTRENAKTLPKLDTRVINGSYVGWLTFDLTAIRKDWVVNPQYNFGLQVMVETMDYKSIQPKAVCLVGQGGPQEKQPFLVAFFRSETVHPRSVRSTGGNHWNKYKVKESEEHEDLVLGDTTEDFMGSSAQTGQRSSIQACGRQELYVSFYELGWQDWIIAPEGYSAYYCDGECIVPLNSHMNATNHAIIQTLVHFINPQMVPKPCCAPTELQDVSVLYFDDGSNVRLKKYKNMVVQACGCQ